MLTDLLNMYKAIASVNEGYGENLKNGDLTDFAWVVSRQKAFEEAAESLENCILLIQQRVPFAEAKQKETEDNVLYEDIYKYWQGQIDILKEILGET